MKTKKARIIVSIIFSFALISSIFTNISMLKTPESYIVLAEEESSEVLPEDDQDEETIEETSEPVSDSSENSSEEVANEESSESESSSETSTKGFGKSDIFTILKMVVNIFKDAVKDMIKRLKSI